MRRVTYFLRVCSGTSSRCHVNLLNCAIPSQDFINFTLRRSLSVKTSNVEEDLPWTAIEQAAKERIYRDDRPNKPFLIVAGKEKLTNRKQVYVLVAPNGRKTYIFLGIYLSFHVIKDIALGQATAKRRGTFMLDID